MEQNVTSRYAILLVVLLFTVGIIAFMVLGGKKDESKSISTEGGQSFDEKYAQMQDQFAQDFPCGITDFDSPHVKAMECDAAKIKKGSPIKVTVVGTVFDEDEGTIDNVAVVVNGGSPVLSDKRGDYSIETEVDSVKKAITIIADKAGYSPVRKVLYAEVPNKNRTGVEVPAIYDTQVIMREAEVVAANAAQDITIVSDKTEGLSITIPAGSLVNSSGETVSGEITGEITYLDPNNPADAVLTPGFDGNAKQMVGINSRGEQVQLGSRGMTFFHFTQKGNEEILQLKKGTPATITQPIAQEDYEQLAEIERTNGADLTEEEMALVRKEKAEMTPEEAAAKEKREADFGFQYWHFNQRTGLWEAWPVETVVVDLESRSYVMKVPAFY